MINLLNENLVFILVLIGFIFVQILPEIQAIDVATTVPPNVDSILKKTNISDVKQLLNSSRRIMVGYETKENKPYMVYLKLPVNNPKYQEYRRWLCGGVIIHEEYILTSAACIEDAKHFYVVSGTYRHDERDDRYNNLCIKNGAKKAVWKCIPRNYIFDGHENDNIRWMNNDIAVVKIEDEFDFTRKIRGCDFVPKPIAYNNQSKRLEEPGSSAVVAGWGSTAKYNEAEGAAQELLEANVKLITKNLCKKRWGKRYHNIIDNYMICSKDMLPDMTEICQEKYVDCTDVMYSEESGETRRVLSPSELVLHYAHNDSRRSAQPGSGGFCENDHGGPLISVSGSNEVVIGIISACLVRERTNHCYGPFLYTSVYKNRNLISCAIYKEVASNCDKLFRSSVTHTEIEMSWVDHPDGPAKNEILKMRRKQEQEAADKSNSTTVINKINSTEIKKEEVLASDKAEQHEGGIVKVFNTTANDKSENIDMTETSTITSTNVTKR